MERNKVVISYSVEAAYIPDAKNNHSVKIEGKGGPFNEKKLST